MNIKNTALMSCAAAGWLLTVVLVAQLLSGTFETRACQSGCVFAMYWAAFGVTAAGLALAAIAWREVCGSVPAMAALAALALLFVLFLTTMAVGTFG